MQPQLIIEKRDGRLTLLAVSTGGKILQQFLPPDPHSDFLYVGSEVGVPPLSGKPVVIVNYHSGHEINGHADWQFVVDLEEGQLTRLGPWQ